MLERGITPMLRELAGVLRGFNPLVRGYNTVGTGIKPFCCKRWTASGGQAHVMRQLRPI